MNKLIKFSILLASLGLYSTLANANKNLCSAGESVVLSCVGEDGTIVSICQKNNMLQYKRGAKGYDVLSVPNPISNQQSIRYHQAADGSYYYRFLNNKMSYTLANKKGKGSFAIYNGATNLDHTNCSSLTEGNYNPANLTKDAESATFN